MLERYIPWLIAFGVVAVSAAIVKFVIDDCKDVEFYKLKCRVDQIEYELYGHYSEFPSIRKEGVVHQLDRLDKKEIGGKK